MLIPNSKYVFVNKYRTFLTGKVIKIFIVFYFLLYNILGRDVSPGGEISYARALQLLRFFMEKILFSFLLLVLIFNYSLIFYNKKFLLNYIKLNFPDDAVIETPYLHPVVYLLPIVIFITEYYIICIYKLISLTEVLLIGLLLLLLNIFSIIVFSIIVCITDKRVVKISSLKIFKFLYQGFNIMFRDIDNLRLYKYGWSTEILIDDCNRKRYRIGGISNIEKIYDIIQSYTCR